MYDAYSKLSGGFGRGNDFPDPFRDLSSLFAPTAKSRFFEVCEQIFTKNGPYYMANNRIVSYFLTDLEFLNVSEDEESKWEEFLENTVSFKSHLKNICLDRQCYGNAFASIVVPFKRWLACPKCGFTAPLGKIYEGPGFAFEWKIPNFIATCLVCKSRGNAYRGPWVVDDRDGDFEKEIKIRRWSPHQIELLHCPVTDDVDYIWKIPESYKNDIKRGLLFLLERCPKPVLEAIAKDQVFRFSKGAIFHMKEPTLGGVVNRGWGISPVLRNFSQICHVQVLRRANEAIALDYVFPFRCITPGMAGGNVGSKGSMTFDHILTSGTDFKRKIDTMVRKRRQDPTAVFSLPFPVQFQTFGADAKQLTQAEMLELNTGELLNSIGAPVEFYTGTMQLQTAPVALRLFEATWQHLVYEMNQFLRWAVYQIGQIMSWEAVSAKLKRVTIADDLEKQMMAAQLMMSQQISATRVLSDMGYSYRQEQKRIADEARFQAEMQARTQEEMEEAGFAQQMAKGQVGAAPPPGAAPPGGAPPGAAPPAGAAPPPGMGAPQGPVTGYIMSSNVPQTPDELISTGRSLAQELLSLPESIKDSELRKLKSYNEALHAFVKEEMANQRRSVRSSAGNAALGQMQQGGM